jgi:hypothetical protein
MTSATVSTVIPNAYCAPSESPAVRPDLADDGGALVVLALVPGLGGAERVARVMPAVMRMMDS